MHGASGLGHNAEFTPPSLQGPFECRLLAAGSYLSRQAHEFGHEASVLPFRNSVHVQRTLLQDSLGPPEGRFRSPGLEVGTFHVYYLAAPQH